MQRPGKTAPPKKPRAKSAASAPNTRPRKKLSRGELAAGQKHAADALTNTPKTQITKKQIWPKNLQAQIRAVRHQLETAPMDPSTLASHYKHKPEKSVTQVLEALNELGMVRQHESGSYRLSEVR